MDVPIELCVSAKVYKASTTRRTVLFVLFLAMYAVVLPFCYYTAGEPRKAAMIAAQKLADEKWANEAFAVPNVTLASNGTLAGLESNGTTTMELDVSVTGDTLATTTSTTSSTSATAALAVAAEAEKLKREKENKLKDSLDRLKAKAASGLASVESSSGGGGGMFGSWFGPSKEQKQAKAEFEKWQKQFNERSATGPVSLPPEYLPSAWACLALFASLSLHALFYLMGHWIIAFKATTLFASATTVDTTCSVLITPPANRGKAAMVPLGIARTTGILQIEFQRQKYFYTPPNKLGSAAKDFPNGVFTLSACPTDLPVVHYTSATGIATDSDVDKLLDRWGKNHVAVQPPSFMTLLQQQMMSPLAIFQVFCAMLWLLDEYWSYTMWSLVSIVIFQVTTVFQTTRTQKMLGGMAPPPTPIFVYRCRKWMLVSTKDLLPGDLISLAFKKRQNQMPTSDAVTTQQPASSASSSAVATTGGGKGGDPKSGTGTAGGDDDVNDVPGGAGGGSSNATTRSDTIPCDCLLLRGAAVVNEASLTGESVPQMKEALGLEVTISSSASSSSSSSSSTTTTATLDMNGLHRVHVLFSGSSLVTVDGTVSTPTTPTSPTPNDKGLREVPSPPDHGAIAYVLRTGFSSSQGALLQMIEFSQQSVSGDNFETGMALLILFLFALVASAYVLKEGLRKKEKTTHEILLKCVIIITSVVPRQFPMQMAMAVNMALMSLIKNGIFFTHCLFDKTGTLTTDQLVPVGVINASAPVFANTSPQPSSSSSSGIITTANVREISPPPPGTTPTSPSPSLGAVSITTQPSSSSSSSSSSLIPLLCPVDQARGETAMVLAACHSLVEVQEDTPTPPPIAGVMLPGETAPTSSVSSPTLVGDPIELAAMKSVGWRWDAESSTAYPGNFEVMMAALGVVRQKIEQLRQVPVVPPPDRPQPTNPTQTPGYHQALESMLLDATMLERKVKEAQIKAKESPFAAVTVLHRHHFSSTLQRMSVVCKCTPQHLNNNNNNNSNTTNNSNNNSEDQWYCLVKGSPEAVRSLLVGHEGQGLAFPSWYSETYEQLARRGLRVLALAYKQVTAKDLGLTEGHVKSRDYTPAREVARQWVESKLCFGGFIAFECKIRADSPMVVRALLDSDHRVAMLTGDALLTSLHVAKQVGICNTSPTVSHNQKSTTKGEKGMVRLPLTLVGTEASVVCPLSMYTPNNTTTATGNTTITGSYWSIRTEDGRHYALPLQPDYLSLARLDEQYDLLTTEQDFLVATEATGGEASPLWGAVEFIRVFARMSPQGKASVIRALQKGTPKVTQGSKDEVVQGDHSQGGKSPLTGPIDVTSITATLRANRIKYDRSKGPYARGESGEAYVLMCGDGGNDVGALKQADVGIALLAGHANANTTETTSNSNGGDGAGAGGGSSTVTVGGAGGGGGGGASGPSSGTTAEDELNARDKAINQRNAEVNAARLAHMKVWTAAYQKKQQELTAALLQEMIAKGEYMRMFSITKEMAAKTNRDAAAENARFMAIHGQVWDEKADDGTGSNQVNSLLKSLETESAGTLPMIRPGDASVAAPFTSRTPSVRAVVDLIRQGRCTLLSSLMQQQIMMLESIIAAYTLSALTLNNARSSERQMMASSWLIMTAAVSFSYAAPLEHMHPLRPLKSLFHPAIFFSIFGQALIHIACMTLAVQWATDAMGPELLKEVAEFFRKAKAKEIDASSLCDEDDFMCQFNAYWTAPFMPNLLNSTVFLVETSQMIAVFFCNYKGRPWMKGMLENHPLFLSVFACIAGVIIASWELVPQLNEIIQLAPFPHDGYYRYKVVILVVATIFGTFTWDRLCTMIFAPQVFAAMRAEAARTTIKDLQPVATTALKIVGVVVLLCTGNIFMCGIAFYWYYKWQQSQTPQGIAQAKAAAEAQKLAIQQRKG